MAGNSIYLPKKDLWEGGLNYPGAFIVQVGVRTFTVPENVSKVLITMAAGGGGGGIGIDDPFAQGGGAGGAGGEVIQFWYDVPPSRVLTFDIGSGGRGQGLPGSATALGAEQGEDTIFVNTNLRARGGAGGARATFDGDGVASNPGGASRSFTGMGSSSPGGNAIGSPDSSATGTHGDPQYNGAPGFGGPFSTGGAGGLGAADTYGAGGGGASLGPGGAGGTSTNIINHPSIPPTNGSLGTYGGGGGGGGSNGGSTSGLVGTGALGGDGAVLIEWVTGEII